MKTITSKQYFQLVGILALAERHKKLIESCVESALEITGESRDYEDRISLATSEAVWHPETISAESLLENLGIKVSE